MEMWDKCAFPVNSEYLKGRKCYAGLDLSSTEDMSAFVLVFPPDDPKDEDDKYIILPFFWIPEDAMRRRVLKDKVPYNQWALEKRTDGHGRRAVVDVNAVSNNGNNSGDGNIGNTQMTDGENWLLVTDGEVINYNYIQQKIEELNEIYNIVEIAFDRWGAVLLAQNLLDAGLNMGQFGQGYKSMSPPSKELMRLVLQKRIAHGGNPILRWHMDNIVVRSDPAGNIKPDKVKATEKIDGAVATIMALDRAIRNEGKESVYNTRGALIIDLNHPDGYYYSDSDDDKN